MVARNESEVAHMNQTSLELRGNREIVIERTFNGPRGSSSTPGPGLNWCTGGGRRSRVAYRWWGATPTFVLAAATATWPG